MLNKRIAVTFTFFSFFALVFNVFTPDNPDHVLNVIELSCLVIVFMLSFFSPMPFSGVLQILSLSAAAFIPMQINDSPFFGAVISVFALVLIYAYGGYRSASWWKLPTTFLVLFFICAIASSRFTPPSFEMWARAFGWSFFISIFCFVLWLIVDDMERRFHSDFASKLIQQNRELLDINEELVKRCKDAEHT